MLELEDGNGLSDVAAKVAELREFAGIPANGPRPIGSRGVGECQADSEGRFAEPSRARTARDAYQIEIGESGASLFQGPGNGSPWNASHAGRPAEFLFFQGVHDGGGIQ